MKHTNEKYERLLKMEKEFQDNNKSFQEENETDYLKLKSYKRNIFYNRWWQYREEVSTLIKDFLTDVISGQDFVDTFFSRWSTVRDNLENIEINFYPHTEASEFAHLIDIIFCDTELFDCDADETEPFNIIWLKENILDSFLKMQKYLD